MKVEAWGDMGSRPIPRAALGLDGLHHRCKAPTWHEGRDLGSLLQGTRFGIGHRINLVMQDDPAHPEWLNRTVGSQRR
jgi:hypothetical protein